MAQNQRDLDFASFNLYNLQLPGKPMYAGGKPYSPEHYNGKIAWSADMIRRLDADGQVRVSFDWNPAPKS